MYGYGSYYAFPILTEIRRENSFWWVASGNWLATVWHWSVLSTFNCFKSNVFLVLISLTYILTGFHVVLVQKVKDLNRTLESCTWEISILCLGQRYLCILTDSSGHPISYSIAILHTLPGSPSANLYWWIAPYYCTLMYGIPISSPF